MVGRSGGQTHATNKMYAFGFDIFLAKQYEYLPGFAGLIIVAFARRIFCSSDGSSFPREKPLSQPLTDVVYLVGKPIK